MTDNIHDFQVGLTKGSDLHEYSISELQFMLEITHRFDSKIIKEISERNDIFNKLEGDIKHD